VKSATKAKQTEEGSNRMKIELGHTVWKGCWLECALCGEGFRAYEVESYTQLPGEVGEWPVCRRCALTGEQWLKHRLKSLGLR